MSAKRNDRLLAVASKSHTHADINDLDDLQPSLLDEVEKFFINYTGQRGKEFRPIGRSDASKARQIVENGRAIFQQKQSGAG